MKRLLALCAMIALTACAGPSTLPTTAEPPPIAHGLRAVAQNRACGFSYSAASPATRPENMPSVVYRCAPRFPTELLRQGMTGSCTTLFRATADGAAIPIETRCVTAGAFGPHADAWSDYAEAIFAAEATRSVASYRLTQADPSRPNEERERLLVVTHFAFEGEPILTEPPQFENAVELTPPPPGGGV